MATIPVPGTRHAAVLLLLALIATAAAPGVIRAQTPGSASGTIRKPVSSQRQTVAGDFWVEPATLRSLGFEWRITGDDNRNASVAVSYRKKGEQAWRPALPMLRLQHESVTGGLPRDGDGQHFNRYEAPNMFAGSILNLEPATQYQARLVLSDPDGVRGTSVKMVTVRTRGEPQPAPGGHVYHVYPFDFKGTRQQPAFTGLLAA